MSGRSPGALALVLHSHMPYVEGFGTWPFGEEWLWEAVSCVYLPLLEVLDGAPVTVGLTPVLCDQLEAMRADAGDRYLDFLGTVRTAVHAEDSSGFERGGEPALAAEVRRAAGDYERAAERFERSGRDLLRAFGELGGVELWTSAATHALLPLLATDAGRRLQVATAVAAHERRFGDWGGGLWVPECAYEPGLERGLVEHGVRAFCVDQTRVPGFDQLRPVRTGAGPVAVPIDWATVELVWHEQEGYPAAPAYRDYHARSVHDLRPWNNAGAPYDHAAAKRLAREHARDFVERAKARLEAGGGGLLCCALDTELLGHWWYEGPEWLAGVLAEARARGLELVTVSAGIELAEPRTAELAPSSWGRGKDLSTWDAPAVAEYAFAARSAELRTVAAAARGAQPRAALERAARELLALQASDWAFMASREMAGDYPRERLNGHLRKLEEALGALEGAGGAPEPELRRLAPDLELATLIAP